MNICECWTKPWSSWNDREDERVCEDDCKCRCHAIEEDFGYHFRQLQQATTQVSNYSVRLMSLKELLEPREGLTMGPMYCRCKEPQNYKVKINDAERTICSVCCGVPDPRY